MADILKIPSICVVVCSDDPVLRDIDSHLHHLEQLLLRLVENSYFKEVEIFYGALGHLANILPQQTTARFSDWAVECCKHEDAEVYILLYVQRNDSQRALSKIILLVAFVISVLLYRKCSHVP